MRAPASEGSTSSKFKIFGEFSFEIVFKDFSVDYIHPELTEVVKKSECCCVDHVSSNRRCKELWLSQTRKLTNRGSCSKIRSCPAKQRTFVQNSTPRHTRNLACMVDTSTNANDNYGMCEESKSTPSMSLS